MKPLPRLPDGSVDPTGDLGNHFDDVMDEANRNPSLARPTGAPSRMEVDEMRRVEQQFWGALQKEANERLSGAGLYCTHVRTDEEDGHYAVELTDGRGRYFTATITMAKVVEIGERYAEDMGRHIIELVCSEAVKARDRYFARMQ